MPLSVLTAPLPIPPPAPPQFPPTPPPAARSTQITAWQGSSRDRRGEIGAQGRAAQADLSAEAGSAAADGSYQVLSYRPPLPRFPGTGRPQGGPAIRDLHPWRLGTAEPNGKGEDPGHFRRRSAGNSRAAGGKARSKPDQRPLDANKRACHRLWCPVGSGQKRTKSLIVHKLLWTRLLVRSIQHQADRYGRNLPVSPRLLSSAFTSHTASGLTDYLRHPFLDFKGFFF
jgi:hypothetical protein